MKARINSEFWEWYRRKKVLDEVEIAIIRKNFEELVEEERRKLGQYDSNEFGIECP